MTTRMTHRHLAAALGLFAVAGAVAGCGWLHDSSTSPSDAIVEKFSGSLKQQGSVVFSFNTSQTGTVDVTLTAMSPQSSATVGLGIGTPSGDTCTMTKSASSVAPATTAQLSVTENAGAYCVKVYDVSSLTETVTVSVTVSHQ